ncbi:hypothetical protein BH09BAC3_BH09BAC3_14820 [soil metagenome]
MPPIKSISSTIFVLSNGNRTSKRKILIMETQTMKITVEAMVDANVKKVWEYWTKPAHIIKWNFASDDWHCPKAENDLRVSGKMSTRMEAKDGSFGFDFDVIYDEVVEHQKIGYTMADGRVAITHFEDLGEATKVTTTFDAEKENSVELQKGGWQAILDNFKRYAEGKKKLEYKINIAANKQKVWDTMLAPTTYKEWVNSAWPGSFFEGEWKEGNNLRFITADGSGTLATLLEHKPYEYSFAKHIAILNAGGIEDRDSELAKGWIGITEAYTFTEKNGATELKVEINTNPDWAKMFDDGWPTALSKLKEICERSN